MLFDTTAAVFRSDPERLARVFELSDDSRPDYRPEELGAILRHQLRAPVEFDLQALDPGSQRLLRAAGQAGDAHSAIQTFGDLFSLPDPPIQLLHLTKNFAKSHLNHPESPLPQEIAAVLYYASIVTALVRWNRHITWLTDVELKRGLEQVLEQPWLDPQTRDLLRTGLKQLAAGQTFLRGVPAEPELQPS